MNGAIVKNIWTKLIEFPKSVRWQYSLIVVGVSSLLASNVLMMQKSALAVVNQPLKVGFIMVGPVNDAGWNYAHDEGRKFLEEKLKDRVQTSFAENVPESGEVERVMEKMIAQGIKLIFSTSYGYLEPALRVAARHPDVVIMQCQRSVPPEVKNVGTYFAKQYEPYYVAGFVAGKVTKKNKMAYVGGHPVPEVINCVDAFAMGAQKANPKVKVQVIWLNSWADAALEAEATRGAVEQGVDVIATQLDSPKVTLNTAEKLNAYCIGCSADLSKQSAKAWLTGQVFNWGPLYVKIADSVMKKTWKQGNEIYGMKDGYVGIGPFGAAVNNKLREQAAGLIRDIEEGKLYVFQGPISDRSGKVRIASGQRADYKTIGQINWLVPGVEGALPKK